MIELDVFREVTVSFLMVGHTGNSVDQLFSIVTQSFKNTEIKTLEELVERVRNSGISPQPEVVIMKYIYDWKSYVMGEHGNRLSDQQLGNHSFYGAFNLQKEEGNVKFR